MSGEKKYPVRITYKGKDGVRYDCGVAWESDRFPGLYDLKPQTTHEQGQYPKMPLAEACQRVAQKDGFLSIALPKPKAAPKPSGGGEGPSDPDIPFRQRDKRGPF